MPKLTHVIFKSSLMDRTKAFYESVFDLKNTAPNPAYLSFNFGNFILGFISGEEVNGATVGHIGLEVGSRKDLMNLFERFQNCKADPSEPIGGPGQGPYRFYVKDPNGYTIEVETWDNACNSNP